MQKLPESSRTTLVYICCNSKQRVKSMESRGPSQIALPNPGTSTPRASGIEFQHLKWRFFSPRYQYLLYLRLTFGAFVDPILKFECRISGRDFFFFFRDSRAKDWLREFLHELDDVTLIVIRLYCQKHSSYISIYCSKFVYC